MAKVLGHTAERSTSRRSQRLSDCTSCRLTEQVTCWFCP
jgi:hypothetical protein